MNPEGVEVRKEWIPERNPSKVMLFAQRDLLENWIKYLEELGFEET